MWVIAIVLLFTLLNWCFQHDLISLNFVFNSFNPYLPLFTKNLQEQKRLTTLNNSISAQDQYATWTKNRRQLDKLKVESDKLKEQIKQFNANCNKFFKMGKLGLITVPFLIFKIWKGKHIIYNLPSNNMWPILINGIWNQGFLYVVLTPLNYLRTGSFNKVDQVEIGVSLGIWCWALNSVLSNIEFIINKLYLQPEMTKPIPNKKSN